MDQFHLSVATDSTGVGGLIAFPMQELIFFTYIGSKKGIEVHSLDLQGFLPGSYDFWLSAIQAMVPTLIPVDRNCALNLAKIEILDKKFKTAYFEQERLREKACSIAIGNFKTVIKELETMNRSFKLI